LKLQKCSWLKFNKERGIFYYKHTLKEEIAKLIPKYSGLVPIAANKKKDFVRFIEINVTPTPNFFL
jgi:hypothetical protein